MESLLPLLDIPGYGWIVVLGVWFLVEWMKLKDRDDDDDDQPVKQEARG